MNLIKAKLKLILIILLGVAIFIGIFLLIFLKTPREDKPTKSVDRAPIKTIDKNDPYVEYANINLLIPGKTTEEEAIALLGKPKGVFTLVGKKYLTYDTPFESFTNFIVIENSVVSYALENVFANYRGRLDDYVKKFGKEDAIFYEPGDEGMWYVFLEEGVAVKILGVMREILYFKPQDKSSFFNNFKDEINLSQEKPVEIDQEFMPEPL